MFGIEENIKKWYENQKIIPVVKSDDEEKTEEVAVYTVAKKQSDNPSRDSLKSDLIKFNKEIERIENQVKYDLENFRDSKYTDKSIKSQAYELADIAYQKELNEETHKTDTNLDNINYKMQSVLNNNEIKTNKINNDYSNYVNETSNKAIKNGVGRSSIVSEETKKYENDKNAKLNEVNLETDVELKNLENSLLKEESRHEKVVKLLDEQKQKDIDKNIENLELERQELINKGVIPTDVVGGPIPELREVEKQVLQNALNYYFSMDRDKAVSEFESDYEIQRLLGDLAPTVRSYITKKGHLKG